MLHVYIVRKVILNLWSIESKANSKVFDCLVERRVKRRNSQVLTVRMTTPGAVGPAAVTRMVQNSSENCYREMKRSMLQFSVGNWQNSTGSQWSHLTMSVTCACFHS